MTDATTLAVAPAQPTPQRCAVYTRVSVDDSKEGEFSSNLAQFEACHAFIASQHHKKWVPNAKLYDALINLSKWGRPLAGQVRPA